MNAEQEKILQSFKQKILSTHFELGKISEVEGNILIKTSYAEGKKNYRAESFRRRENFSRLPVNRQKQNCSRASKKQSRLPHNQNCQRRNCARRV